MLAKIFTWWSGATIGALFDVNKRAAFVGTDEEGNRYFEERKPSLEGRKRRYVLYNKGYAEASRVPPDWHGWLHHTFDKPPTEAPLPRKVWEIAHKPNMTGTAHAYRPKGSLYRGGGRAPSTGDYEAWDPDA